MSAAYSNLFMDQGSTFETSIVLDEMDRSIHDSSSNELFIKPEDGMIIITNAWMPHSFTQNLSNKNFKFVHFNIGVEQIRMMPPEQSGHDVEVI